LASDRDSGVELDKAPLMRCALMRMGSEKYEFVWSFHHIILDGCSWPILLQDIWGFYSSIKGDLPFNLAPPRPYRDYITWLQQQDIAQGEEFWRETLSGFTASTSLGIM